MQHIEVIDFPKPWLLFYTAMLLSLLYMTFSFYRKWRGWSRGISDPTSEGHDYARSAKIWLAEVFFQRQLFALSFTRWLVHALIFGGFMGLVLLSAVAVILHSSGSLAVSTTNPRFYLIPEGYLLMKIWGDSFGLMLLLGIVLSGIRRFVLRPAQQSTNQQDLILLALLFLAVLTGFVLEGLRLSLVPSAIARYSYIGRIFMPPGTHTLAQLQPWLTGCWTFHFFLVATLFAYLPHSKLRHIFLAPVIIGMNAVEEQARGDIYWPEIKKYKPTKSRQD